MAQESESKVDGYSQKNVQLIPRSSAVVGIKPSSEASEKKKKHTDESIYIKRI